MKKLLLLILFAVTYLFCYSQDTTKTAKSESWVKKYYNIDARKTPEKDSGINNGGVNSGRMNNMQGLQNVDNQPKLVNPNLGITDPAKAISGQQVQTRQINSVQSVSAQPTIAAPNLGITDPAKAIPGQQINSGQENNLRGVQRVSNQPNLIKPNLGITDPAKEIPTQQDQIPIQQNTQTVQSDSQIKPVNTLPPVISQPYRETRLGSSSPLYDTYRTNDNGAGSITNQVKGGSGIVPAPTPEVSPATVTANPQIYRDTRLGSSSPLYNTYRTNDNGAGAITNQVKGNTGGITASTPEVNPATINVKPQSYNENRLGSSSPLYDTYEKNDNGAGSVTNQVKGGSSEAVSIPTAEATPVQVKKAPQIYRDTRLGSSSSMYDTYEKNDNGAGAITNNPNKWGSGAAPVLVPVQSSAVRDSTSNKNIAEARDMTKRN